MKAHRLQFWRVICVEGEPCAAVEGERPGGCAGDGVVREGETCYLLAVIDGEVMECPPPICAACADADGISAVASAPLFRWFPSVH